MSLTVEQVNDLVRRYAARMDEFRRGISHLSDGEMRIVYEVIEEWQMEAQRGVEALEDFAANQRIEAYQRGVAQGRAEAAVVRFKLATDSEGRTVEHTPWQRPDTSEDAKDTAIERRRESTAGDDLDRLTREEEREMPSIDEVTGISDDVDPAHDETDPATQMDYADDSIDPDDDEAKWDFEDTEANLAALSGLPPRPTLSVKDALSPQAAATLGPEHTVISPLRSPVGAGRGKLPHPDMARERLAQALAKGSGGNLVQAINAPRTLAEVDDDEDGDEDEPQGGRYKTSPEERQRAKEYRQRNRRDRRRPPAENGEIKGRRGNVLPTLEEVIAELRRISMDKKTMPSLAQFDASRPGNWATADAQCARLNLTWTELAERAELTPRVGGRPALVAASIHS